MMAMKCPDPQKVLRQLKPFQRDTVEYVFRRMYLDPDHTRRFLVADEVGLGKTMVAKGVLAKAIDHLWDRVDRIDVVYICSNADIARQNINRLNMTGGGVEFAYRITLLPIYLNQLDPKLNFISFTPGTSFDMKWSMGLREERRLLYWMLREAWNFGDKCGPKNVLQGYVSDAEEWREYLRAKPQFDPKIAEGYVRFLETGADQEREGGEKSLEERFAALSDFFYRSDREVPSEIASERTRVIAKLRRALAKTCLKLLEPDVVIMDEFQRFKNLLTEEDEAGELAQELFNYGSEHSEVRTLLLSATPYKMYTQYGEEDDDHYEDFLETVRFLEGQPPAEVKTILKDFRQELFRCHDGQLDRLLEIKSQLEQRLRKIIARKERIAGSLVGDDMLTDRSEEAFPALTPADVRHYLALQKIARILEHGDLVEYWKSASYLLNFMDGYKIKDRLREAMKDKRGDDIAAVIDTEPSVVVPWEQIGGYRSVPPANPRLQKLMDETMESEMWQLLWMPPSLPYYTTTKGPYSRVAAEHVTKRLVFSSWNVVPKVIAALVSYDAERRMFAQERDATYTTEWRKNQGTLLKFAVNERHTGMPVLGMLYPCFTLARFCDPLSFLSESVPTAGTVPSLDAVSEWGTTTIESLLSSLSVTGDSAAAVDENWYWAAPILLDLQHDKEAATRWLGQDGLEVIWKGRDDSEADDKESNWGAHVRKARELAEGKVCLGRRPDDLAQVLTLLSFGGPGVAALRALCRITGGDEFYTRTCHRNAAARVAWGFRSFFNRPEVTCLVRGLGPGVYWHRVLEYCTDGGLQAVLDEYVHILQEFLGLAERGFAETAHAVAAAIAESLQLITARIDVDRVQPWRSKKESMRAHFALRFGVQDSEEGSKGEQTREDKVRQAFNSPFWPFVLASTSVGQEGLDFHPYCHAVVHWNLPANPVDLEQREGRVHRYKGHAVRKNIAKAYSRALLGNGFCDPWRSMFAAAVADHGKATRGLAPFWNFPLEGGARVERHVPALPFSRDALKLIALRKNLAVYRMVFGQSRQEDLVEYLLQHLPEDQVETVSRMLQIDLSAPPVDLY